MAKKQRIEHNGLTEEAEEPPCDAFVGRKAPVRKWQRCCWCCTCMLRGVGARWIGTRGSEPTEGDHDGAERKVDAVDGSLRCLQTCDLWAYI
jgi:hypothetical protein